MRNIRIAAAQFTALDRDKQHNLARVEALTAQAAADSAELVCFHECSIPGYTFLENLPREEIVALAEPVPAGPSIDALQQIAKRHNVGVAAGLLELADDKIYNTYVVVDPDEGVVAKHRKIHAFVSEHLALGDEYTVFDWRGCRFGILICYDCNLVENPRMTAMLGAEILLAPHVTGCLPSPMPGRGLVSREVWDNRETDPVRCRQEFDGPKGRGWLMRWLPARAYDNGLYIVYTNPIGDESGTIKGGGSVILDPFGEVLEECRKLGDDVVTATLTSDKREVAPGKFYVQARRPELYAKFVEPNPDLAPDGKPVIWWKKHRQ